MLLILQSICRGKCCGNVSYLAQYSIVTKRFALTNVKKRR